MPRRIRISTFVCVPVVLSPSPGQRTVWVEPGTAAGHWILHTESFSAAHACDLGDLGAKSKEKHHRWLR